MAPPTWTVGQVLAAADVNSWFVPLVAVKGSDQSVTSSTTLVGDTALFVPLAANGSYEVRCMINYEGGTRNSSDLKWGFSVPGGSTMRYSALFVGPGGSTNVQMLTGTSTNTAGSNGAGVIQALQMTGSITTSSTAGNLQLQWAQGTSSGTATIVHATSYLIAQRIS